MYLYVLYEISCHSSCIISLYRNADISPLLYVLDQFLFFFPTPRNEIFSRLRQTINHTKIYEVNVEIGFLSALDQYTVCLCRVVRIGGETLSSA